MGAIMLIALVGGFVIPAFWTSSSSEITMDVCAFDANGDEHLDVVFAIYKADGNGELQLYINNNGQFSQIPNWTTSHSAAYQSVCVGDVDNDGDNDIAAGTVRAGTQYANNCLFLNDGTGDYTQTPVWISSDDLDTVHLQLVDVDSDGWLELIGANHNSRVLLYENYYSEGGSFSQQPIKLLGNASITTFAVSQLPIEDSNNEVVDILCANPHFFSTANTTILIDKIFGYFGSGIPQVREVWADNRSKPYMGYWFQCIDVNADSFSDWVSSCQNGIIYGEYDPSYDTYNQVEIEEVNGYPSEDTYDFMSMMKVFAVDLVPESISSGCELFVCNRGKRQFIPGIYPPEHEMHQSEDLLLHLDFVDGVSASVVWQSSLSVSTTSASFFDINRSGIEVLQKDFFVTIPNQMFVLDVPFERILTVIADGVQLKKSDYHYDRNTGIISLIGDYTGSMLSVYYEYSISLDVVCSTADNDVMLINEY